MSEELTNSQKILNAHHEQVKLCFPNQLQDGEQAIWMTPGFEARDDNPSKDYGVGGVTITFAKRKGNRIIDVSFLTAWYPLDVQKKSMGKDVERHGGGHTYPEVCQVVVGEQPLCQGFYRHELVKPDDWNEWMSHREDCLLVGGECWGEVGSALYGETIRDRLLVEGSAGVWDEIDKALEDW